MGETNEIKEVIECEKNISEIKSEDGRKTLYYIFCSRSSYNFWDYNN